MLLLLTLATVIIFLLGELPLASHLFQNHSTKVDVLDMRFILFVITRLVGITGQLYLWSVSEIGRIAVLMGVSGVLASNVLGTYVFHQNPLSVYGYMGVMFAVISLVFLTFLK